MTGAARDELLVGTIAALLYGSQKQATVSNVNDAKKGRFSNLRGVVMMWSLAAAVLALLGTGAMAQLKTGTKAPNFTAKDLKGKTVRLSQLRGNHPAIVNFFATW